MFAYDGTWALHRPEVVVSPLTTEEVAAVVAVARRLGAPIVPRGGGTGLAGGRCPLKAEWWSIPL